MRMNYKTYPTDYIQELKQQRGVAGRKKARAFMEYHDDMEHEEHHSFGFYAKSWGVSKSTAYVWIREFSQEIENFIANWALKNQQHYSYAKKSTERQPNEKNRDNAQKQEISSNQEKRQPNEEFNNYNNNMGGEKSDFEEDKDFNDFYFVYSRNTKYAGNKKEAYKAFKRVAIDVNFLKLAAMRYLNDKVVDKPVGAKKFLLNDIYAAYMPKFVKVFVNGSWIEALYNSETHAITAKSGQPLGFIEPKLLVELFETNKLIYLNKFGEN